MEINQNEKQSINLIRFDSEQNKDPFLKDFTNWSDVPNFAVITGLNGAGKTHVLEYIHRSYESIFYLRNNQYSDYNGTSDETLQITH